VKACDRLERHATGSGVATIGVFFTLVGYACAGSATTGLRRPVYEPVEPTLNRPCLSWHNRPTPRPKHDPSAIVCWARMSLLKNPEKCLFSILDMTHPFSLFQLSKPQININTISLTKHKPCIIALA
jgi:hypothetical protein